MVLTAAVLALGLNIELDLGALFKHYQKVPGSDAVCGIKVVGYHIAGKPGQQFRYARETFEIPAEGYVEVIALPRVKHFTFEGRKLALDGGNGAMDAFSFRWIDLPASTEGASTHE